MVMPERALNGEIHTAPIEVRGVWWTLLNLVGDGNLSDYGVYGVSHRLGYEDKYIAEALNVDVATWIKARDWLTEPHNNEKPLIVMLDNGLVAIVHWSKYQREYDRIKKYKHPERRAIYDEIQAEVQQKIQAKMPPEGTGKDTGKSTPNVGGRD